MINEGDLVILWRSLEPERIKTIHRVTKTQAIVLEKNYTGGTYERKFNRESGREVGVDWRPFYVRAATTEEVEKIKLRERRGEMIKAVKNTEWEKATTEQLEAVMRILKPAEENDEAAESEGAE